MASFVIEGGHRLSGEIHPQGAKNEVLQIICATLLTAEEVTVHNIPDILDVNNLIQLMRDMGVTVSRKGLDTYCFKAEKLDLSYLESDEFLKKCSSLRGSVMLIGPMVAYCFFLITGIADFSIHLFICLGILLSRLALIYSSELRAACP